MKLYRGVDESTRVLPQSIVDTESHDGFTGGVEPAFMSTTAELGVGFHFSGGVGKPGTIFEFECDLVSRGADVQSISMYPSEKEFLWPPCTAITVISVCQKGAKRMITARATVSAARYDMGSIATVDDKPPSTLGNFAKLQPEEQTWLFNYGIFPESFIVHVIGGSEDDYSRQTMAASTDGWLRVFTTDGTATLPNLTPAICVSAERYGGTTFGCASCVTGYQLQALNSVLAVSNMHRLVDVDIELRGGGLVHGITFCQNESPMSWQMPSYAKMDEVCRVISSHWKQGSLDATEEGMDAEEWCGVTLTVRNTDGTKHAEYDPAERSVSMY
jgi:hypothetical protein